MVICNNFSRCLILPTILIGVIFSISSCDNTGCENKNAVFDRFASGTKEYQAELAKQVQDAGMSNITYSFEKYFQKDGEDFIVVNMKGPGLCAKGEMLVQEWGNMEGIHAAKGGGYTGAGLAGFRFRITQDAISPKFIYKSVDRVID